MTSASSSTGATLSSRAAPSASYLPTTTNASSLKYRQEKKSQPKQSSSSAQLDIPAASHSRQLHGSSSSTTNPKTSSRSGSNAAATRAAAYSILIGGVFVLVFILYIGWEEVHETYRLIRLNHHKHAARKHVNNKNKRQQQGYYDEHGAHHGTIINGTAHGALEHYLHQHRHNHDASAAEAHASLLPPKLPEVKKAAVKRTNKLQNKETKEKAKQMVMAYSEHLIAKQLKEDELGDADLILEVVQERVQADTHIMFQGEDKTLVDKVIQEAWSQIRTDERHRKKLQKSKGSTKTKKHNLKAKNNKLDKHIRKLERVREDCIGSDGGDGRRISLDVTSEDYSVDGAISVLRNCKLLVLRNVLDTEWMESTLLPRMTGFAKGIKDGTIDSDGETTNGEPYYMAMRDHNRWEVILPEAIVHDSKDEILLNREFLDILQDPVILGSQMALHSAGMNFAAPGANGQTWHEDEQYPFDTTSFRTLGVAGHDIPSFAVTMSIPLVDRVTAAHGPTEFCMGSSALMGTEVWNIEWDARNEDDEGFEQRQDFIDAFIDDPSLIADGTTFDKFVGMGYRNCHPDFWLAPQLNMGDILFFDYQLKHRGGWNTHPTESRPIMFLTYGRFWFKDCNFQTGAEAPEDYNDLEFRLTKSARFAIPNNYLSEHHEKDVIDTDLTKIGPIEIDSGIQEADKHPDKKTKHEFVVSNKNIIPDVDPSRNDGKVYLYVDEHNHGILLPHESNQDVTARWGQTLSLRTSSNYVLVKWGPIHGNQKGQIIFHNGM